MTISACLSCLDKILNKIEDLQKESVVSRSKTPCMLYDGARSMEKFSSYKKILTWNKNICFASQRDLLYAKNGTGPEKGFRTRAAGHITRSPEGSAQEMLCLQRRTHHDPG